MRAILRAALDELRAVFTDGQVRSILLVSLVIYAVIYPLPYLCRRHASEDVSTRHWKNCDSKAVGLWPG